MKQDRFLIGILIFIGLLVAAALALFFIRKDTTTYQPDDTPAGVVYNFALALQRDDLSRAYGYLADLKNKPTETEFRRSILNGSVNVSSNALQVGEVTTQGDDEAWVAISIEYISSGPFDSGSSNMDRAALVRQAGQWKISYMPYPYWSYDWYPETPVPAKP